MSQRWSRILKTPVGIVGLGLLAFIVLLAVFAPILWGDKASAVDTENLLAGPSAQHWFGTDNLGRGSR
jgi:ABC-type dipeptide/oligopeptide/nickel transport system permease subunit